VVANNAIVNGNGIGLDPAVSAGNNVQLTLANGAGQYVSYTPLTPVPPNDFHLLAGDSAFKAKGINLSSQAPKKQKPDSAALTIGLG
jgi:hypothetical protein